MNILQDIEYLIELNLNRTLGPSSSWITKHILQQARQAGKVGKLVRNDYLELSKIFPVNSPHAVANIKNAKDAYKTALVNRRKYIDSQKMVSNKI